MKDLDDPAQRYQQLEQQLLLAEKQLKDLWMEKRFSLVPVTFLVTFELVDCIVKLWKPGIPPHKLWVTGSRGAGTVLEEQTAEARGLCRDLSLCSAVILQIFPQLSPWEMISPVGWKVVLISISITLPECMNRCTCTSFERADRERVMKYRWAIHIFRAGFWAVAVLRFAPAFGKQNAYIIGSNTPWEGM